MGRFASRVTAAGVAAGIMIGPVKAEPIVSNMGCPTRNFEFDQSAWLGIWIGQVDEGVQVFVKQQDTSGSAPGQLAYTFIWPDGGGSVNEWYNLTPFMPKLGTYKITVRAINTQQSWDVRFRVGSWHKIKKEWQPRELVQCSSTLDVPDKHNPGQGIFDNVFEVSLK